jgi:cyclin B
MFKKDNEENLKGKKMKKAISENLKTIDLKTKIPYSKKNNLKENIRTIISKNKRIKRRIPLSKEINSSNFENLTISTNITTQRKKDYINDNNIEALKKNINFNKKENSLIRTRSGKKNNQSFKTSPEKSNSSNNKENVENLNIKFDYDKFKVIEKFNIDNKRFNNYIKEEDFNLIKNNNNNIENIIKNDSYKQIKLLKEKYKKIFDNENNNLQNEINKINIGLFSYNINNIEINKNQRALFTRKEYKQLLTTENKLEYGNLILEEFFLKQETTKNILINHEITPKMRLKMIDWMIEVFYNLKCKDITFFTCVNIMDRFFILTKKKFKPENLHLIGICSIFIASKFCEVYPIKLINLIEKVGHNKFSKNDILNMEKMILECLNYDILRPYSIDFAEYFFEDLFSFFENNFNIHNKYLEEYLRNFIEKLNIKICLDKFYFDKCESVKKYNEKMRNFLWLVIIYLLKMCNHDYELIQEKPSLIAASSILVGMRICEILNNENYVNELFIENLSKISKENQYNLLFCSSKILTKAQNFHKENNDIHNLYNTHFEMINQIHFTQ